MSRPVVLTPPDLGVDEDDNPIPPVFDDWLAFHDELLVTWYPVICPEWRSHPLAEASVRALWFAWEGAEVNPEPGAMATFLAHQCIPIMRELLDCETFRDCKGGKHRPPRIGAIT